MYAYTLDVLDAEDAEDAANITTVCSEFATDISPVDAVRHHLLVAYVHLVNNAVVCAHCHAPQTATGAKSILMSHVVYYPSGPIRSAWGSLAFSCPNNQTCVHAVATRVRVHWKAVSARLQAEGESGALFRKCHACGKCEDKNNTNTSKFPVCGRCKNVHYCSAKCQRSDWNVHKNMCAKE